MTHLQGNLTNYCNKFCTGISVLCQDRNHSLVQVHVYRAYTAILGLQFLCTDAYEPYLTCLYLICTHAHANYSIMYTSRMYTSTLYTSLFFCMRAYVYIHMCVKCKMCYVTFSCMLAWSSLTILYANNFTIMYATCYSQIMLTTWDMTLRYCCKC